MMFRVAVLLALAAFCTQVLGIPKREDILRIRERVPRKHPLYPWIISIAIGAGGRRHLLKGEDLAQAIQRRSPWVPSSFTLPPFLSPLSDDTENEDLLQETTLPGSEGPPWIVAPNNNILAPFLQPSDETETEDISRRSLGGAIRSPTVPESTRRNKLWYVLMPSFPFLRNTPADFYRRGINIDSTDSLIEKVHNTEGKINKPIKNSKDDRIASILNAINALGHRVGTNAVNAATTGGKGGKDSKGGNDGKEGININANSSSIKDVTNSETETDETEEERINVEVNEDDSYATRIRNALEAHLRNIQDRRDQASKDPEEEENTTDRIRKSCNLKSENSEEDIPSFRRGINVKMTSSKLQNVQNKETYVNGKTRKGNNNEKKADEEKRGINLTMVRSTGSNIKNEETASNGKNTGRVLDVDPNDSEAALLAALKRKLELNESSEEVDDESDSKGN